MGKMARNRGIFAAGLDFGECAGYAVDADGKPVAQYNGMIGIRKQRVPSAAYVDINDVNNWEMQAPTSTSKTDDTLWILIADETTSAVVNGQRYQNLGRRTADMEIPAGLSVRWYKLAPADFFDLGAKNFTGDVGANKFAALTAGSFDLTPQTAKPTAAGVYFKIDTSRDSNIGGSSGGALYLVDVAYTAGS